MATSITPATLTLTVKEGININGSDNGAVNYRTITNVTELLKRIVTCPAGVDTTVLQFASAVNVLPGDLDVDDVKYLRITNKDDTNAVKVGYVTTNTVFTINLGAAESHIFGPTALLAIADDDSTAPTFPTLENLVKVIVDPASNAVDVEVFVAST